jgi:tRNA(Ile)-lysidine synthase
MLLAARWKSPVKFSVLTVDHGLRPESGREAQQVVTWARGLGFDAHKLSWRETKPATGLQAQARKARYRLMAQWCARHEADGVVSAHTLDDQAETFLMRLARGSGSEGLSAMARDTIVHGVRVLRPLLEIRREKLRVFVKGEGQAFFDDPSNDDTRFERVRVRKAQLALSRAGITPQALAMAARRMGRAREALERSTDGLQGQCVTFENEGHAIVDLAAFAAAPEEIRLRLLARLFARIGGSSDRPELSAIERFGAWLAGGEGQARTLGGCRVKRRHGSFIIGRESGRMAKTPIAIRPGETQLFDERFRVRLEASKGQTMMLLPLGLAKGAGLVKRPKNLPEFVFRTLPALVVGDDVALVPHIGYSRPGLEGRARAEVTSVAGPHNSLTIQ